jgi:hypothetical protein
VKLAHGERWLVRTQRSLLPRFVVVGLGRAV